ncbi:uncharacterized protein LOC143184761 [Calliopsis andreniformis]|uniref:uncharacterized protein LOC143184761 n=1 Tax=Calliopsis andreniformis TaxID=337506 RepID=UPI003FCCC234
MCDVLNYSSSMYFKQINLKKILQGFRPSKLRNKLTEKKKNKTGRVLMESRSHSERRKERMAKKWSRLTGEKCGKKLDGREFLCRKLSWTFHPIYLAPLDDDNRINLRISMSPCTLFKVSRESTSERGSFTLRESSEHRPLAHERRTLANKKTEPRGKRKKATWGFSRVRCARRRRVESWNM